MIKLQVIGHLGKDAVVNRLENGATVINFNVAHSAKYKDKQGATVNKTTWVSCSYWTEKTGIAPYLKKGTQVFVEGEPEADFYNAGGNIGITGQQKCRVQKVELLGSSKQGEGAGSNQGNAGSGGGGERIPHPNEITEPIDDLPF